MTTDKIPEEPDALGIARPGSPLAQRLRSEGNYVPKSLVTDMEEALRFIGYEKFNESAGDMAAIRIQLRGPGYEASNRHSIWIHLQAANGQDIAMEYIKPAMQAYAKNHPEIRAENIQQYLEISGNNYRDILNALNEGFIKPNYPEANIDVDARMMGTERTWVDRTSRLGGHEEGVGSPG